ATFLMLWQRRRSYRYPLLLALAFFMSGLGFAANDFLASFDGPALRVAANAFFLVSVLAACVSAFVRIDAPIPTTFFAVLCVLCATSFVWFLFIEPSTFARILIVNGTFAALASVTTWVQIRSKPKSTVDWLFVCLAGSILVQAIARPAAIIMQGLDINPDGPLRDSEYWATVQALTPLLTLVLALSFLVAFAVQVFNELRDEADQDYLSGLLNRRGFDAQANVAIRASPVKRWQPAVMIADIDNFKLINDTFGHSVGDHVIAAIARILGSHSHANIVGRTGGEEFGLYYDEARRSELLSHAAAIRAEISRASVDQLPRGYPLTISIGIHHRYQTESLSEMMREADHALYAAKAAGKDQAFITPLKLHSVDRTAVSR
ncbi:GGDEF domain-containing protein, partial [Mesorhizobium sp. SB112]|uniref:GGDEF domain-containing protein n=1 Tax=Mesorhizobium sp. SB112 TaxID=3151853 RepID=UPI003267353B